MRHPDPFRAGPGDAERGAALVMTLIVVALLYAITWQLVRTAETARIVGTNEILIARMRQHMEFTRAQVEDMLRDDLGAASAGEGEGAGGMGGLPGGLGGAAGGAGPGGEGEGEGEEDPAAIADGSQDAWFEPTAYTDNDITTYVWVEDENRKFNILTLVSPDEEFARKSRERFVRLIDALREGTEWDRSAADGESMAQEIIDWMESRGRGTDSLPRPKLKSDSEERTSISLPLHLDELLLLPNIEEDLFFDRVFDGRVVLGLESVLTIHTSKVYDPGDPEDPSNPVAGANESGGAGGEGGGPGNGGQGGGEGGNGELAEQPLGVGIRININTAPRPVLRCLFPPTQVSDTVIDAIIRYRNEEMEETDTGEQSAGNYTLYLDEGIDIQKQMFTEVAQLEEIPEFENLPDPDLKDEFMNLLTTRSDTFSVHFASIFKRSEENRTYVIQRARSTLVRLEGDEEPEIHPIVFLEARSGLRVMGEDDVDFDLTSRASRMAEMDAFSQEERAWNPFYVDFYRPDSEREELFDYRERLR